jgi:hypothetical protein
LGKAIKTRFLCRYLDFVSRWEGVSIREASQVLTKNFVDGKTSHEAATTMKQEARPVREIEERAITAPRATSAAAASSIRPD